METGGPDVTNCSELDIAYSCNFQMQVGIGALMILISKMF